MIYHIIRASATKTSRPDYFPVETPNGVDRHVADLKDSGWFGIESKAITVRDHHLDGILKRCSLGSKMERSNLQAYYNEQP